MRDPRLCATVQLAPAAYPRPEYGALQEVRGATCRDRRFTLMGADLPPGGEHTPRNNIAVSLSGDDADELRGYWKKLSDDGAVSVPLEKQIWGDEFGMCNDRFGITWMVNIGQTQT